MSEQANTTNHEILTGLNATESSPLQWAVSFKNSLLIGSSDWSKFETKVESRFGNKVYKYKISKYFLTNPLSNIRHRFVQTNTVRS